MNLLLTTRAFLTEHSVRHVSRLWKKRLEVEGKWIPPKTTTPEKSEGCYEGVKGELQQHKRSKDGEMSARFHSAAAAGRRAKRDELNVVHGGITWNEAKQTPSAANERQSESLIISFLSMRPALWSVHILLRSVVAFFECILIHWLNLHWLAYQTNIFSTCGSYPGLIICSVNFHYSGTSPLLFPQPVHN